MSELRNRLIFAIGGLAVGALTLIGTKDANAWAIAPQHFIEVGEMFPTIYMVWTQEQLQTICADAPLPAGHVIYGCSWVTNSMCFVATFDALNEVEREALIRLHELPHCAGWNEFHPQSQGEWTG